MFKEIEVVELAHDIKGHNLKKGERGTIVEIYKDGEAYEVEFIAPDGKTSILLTLIPDDIRPIINKEVYLSHEFNVPVYLSTVTLSGMTFNVFTEDILRGFNAVDLEIKTERKTKANTEEFYYPRTIV